MPYTIPTPDQFVARFPVFAETDPAIIQALLTEASASVSQSWREDDYQPAIMYLTAHLIATDNSAEGSDVFDTGGQNEIASESFGGMSVSYRGNASGGSLSSSEQYGSTIYGQRFLAMLKKNNPAILVV